MKRVWALVLWLAVLAGVCPAGAATPTLSAKSAILMDAESGRILYAYQAEEERPIATTLELVDIIKGAMPARALKEKQHPAKRSFQAIRIAVNDELASVERMLKSAVPRLNKGGRLAVITFHSLEDRIVKTTLGEFARGCICPPDFPVCVCGRTPEIRLVNKKPILPGGREVEENPRARSAKLRVAEKLHESKHPSDPRDGACVEGYGREME